jgi:hypothetical protein
MGGKGGSAPGVSPAVSSEMQNAEMGLVNLANTQVAQAGQLFNLVEPGLATAENQFETLASGDPGALMRVIAPAAQATNEAATGARSNIMANAPAGGEKNLALENVDVNRAKQIASTASGASLSAPASLAGLAGQTIPEALSGQAGAGTSLSAASSSAAGLGSLQLQGQELAMEQKGQELGAFGGLAGDVSQIGSSMIGANATKGLTDALAFA